MLAAINNREVSTMIAAASALPLLLIAQLAHVQFQYDLSLGGEVIFVDRAVYVASLGAYAAWLNVQDAVPKWSGRMLAVLVGSAILAVFLPRMYAIPLIWFLQLGILVALALWAHDVRRDWWRCGFVGVALFGQAVGALTIMPLCQLGASPMWLALPQAQYVCNHVIGPGLAALLPAAMSGAVWVILVTAAMARKHV